MPAVNDNGPTPRLVVDNVGDTSPGIIVTVHGDPDIASPRSVM